ncbi:hypothetical protein ADL26_19395, partial [Thermoactinomyces vulgaris]
GDPAPGEAQARDGGVVEDDRAGVDGRADRHQRHAGVVHLVVAVDRDGLEVVGAQFGDVALGLGGGDDVADAVAERGERGVGEDASAELRGPVRSSLVDGQVELERAG